MVHTQAEQLAPDIVSVSMLMYGATISRPIALDTAAQKQNGHVIRGAPNRERQTRGGRVCINEDRMLGLTPVYVLNNTNTRLVNRTVRSGAHLKQTLARRGLKFL